MRQAGGRVLLRFRLAAGTYYPLTAAGPAVSSPAPDADQVSAAQKPEPGDNERLAMYKTYTSAPRLVAVRPLPAPGGVAVGDYLLHEKPPVAPQPRAGDAFHATLLE
ncbi:MAG: hypothetical protein WKG07_16310 [Hymenobacter sp.]